jgi:hypothetical protein
MYRILAGVTEAAAASVYGIAEDHSRVFATWSRDLEGQAERLARSADIGGADARRAEQ